MPAPAHPPLAIAPRQARRVLGCASLWLVAAVAHGQAAPEPPMDLGTLGQQASALIQDGARASLPGARIEVEVGQLDPRLRLAPCRKITPYLPPGLPAWGKTRVGLRCEDGRARWNVSLPVTVHVWTISLVARGALPAGTVLDASHLQLAEVDLAAAPGRAVSSLEQALGRTLARTVADGAALRLPDLKSRQWFAAGDTVRLVAVGPGWRIASEGQAVTAGIEGQMARVRTEGGRVVQGRPVAEREMEVQL